jgi:predicted amidohydrolase
MLPVEYSQYNRSVKVSAVNFSAVWGNKEATLEKTKRIINAAAGSGTNIIAFPELALSGYECSGEARRDQVPCAMHEAAAETVPGPSTEVIAALTRKLGVYVLLGMPERDLQDPKVKYISVAVIGPEGVLGTYRKIHLGSPPAFTETVCFQPGSEVPVFETRYGPVGVQICADFWHYPELSRLLWYKSARLVFNCTANTSKPGNPLHIVHTTITRAHESHIYVASANMCGREKELTYAGHSCIAGPFPLETGRAMAEGGEQEEIVSATLDFDKLHEQSDPVKLRKKVALQLITDEYNELAKDIVLRYPETEKV